MINWTPISFCLAKVAKVGIRRDIYWPRKPRKVYLLARV